MTTCVLLLATIRLAAPFSDGAVLQCERPVAVWGTAGAGERVTVRFGETAESATADGAGRWKLRLPPMKACSDGRTLRAEGTSGSDEAHDVLVGEVWFVSGQSNAVCPFWCTVAPRFRAQQKGGLIAQYVDKPTVRFTDQPGEWKRMNPANLVKKTTIESGPCKGSFSAMGTFFALKLEDVLRVPVGMIGEYINGSPIEPWIPPSGSHWRSCVARWTPYTIRGILWNQGDSNVKNATEYDGLLRRLYDGWCAAFEQQGLSFYFQEQHHGSSDCFELQLAQQRFAASEPHAALSAGNDMPCAKDVHGNEKETMARRLLVHALRRDYGYAAVKDESPTFARWRVEGDRAVVTFDHAESLCIYNEAQTDYKAAFELAGADGVWKPAEVVFKPLDNWASNGLIPGSNLTLRAEGVLDPKRVRYLHAGRGNVYNEVCLPLLAFEVSEPARF